MRVESGKVARNQSFKFALNEKFCLRRRAVRTNAIFDSNNALLVFAEGRVNETVIFPDMAVNDGEVFFVHRTAFENFAELTGCFGVFCDEHDTAGFAVETVYQIWNFEF